VPNWPLDGTQSTSTGNQSVHFSVNPFFSPKTAHLRRTQLKRRLIASWDETDPISNLLVRRVKIIKRYRMRFVLNEG